MESVTTADDREKAREWAESTTADPVARIFAKDGYAAGLAAGRAEERERWLSAAVTNLGTVDRPWLSELTGRTFPTEADARADAVAAAIRKGTA